MMVVWPTFPAHRAGSIINLSSTSNCYQQMRCVKFKNKETTTQTRPYIYIYIFIRKEHDSIKCRVHMSLYYTNRKKKTVGDDHFPLRALLNERGARIQFSILSFQGWTLTGIQLLDRETSQQIIFNIRRLLNDEWRFLEHMRVNNWVI